MIRVFPAVLLSVFALVLVAQRPDISTVKAASPAAAQPAAPNDLPVRKVVLYKNGVGYFEHSGTVNGNQRVAIDFTSSQLNDVLQSLTALDSNGGMVSAVSYNSTTPIDQQLNSLSLGLKVHPMTLSVYRALCGQRVEVTGAGAPLTGRLVNLEHRKETDKSGTTSEDRYYLIVATDTGALRTAELTDAVSVRMLDASLEKQFASYLEIVASAQNQQTRHLTLEDRGQGERQLQVSYISEVPVWKSTYRIVFPRDPNGSATVQGWAVVDNTVGVDWDNVQLSLVAGAPQSFIQPLSQPIYARRPVIPIATAAQTTPQTHEAAETVSSGAISGIVTDTTGAVIPGATVTATAQGTNATTTSSTSSDGSFTISPLTPGLYTLTVVARGFQGYQRNIDVGALSTATANVSLNVGAASQMVTVVQGSLAALAPAAPGASGGLGSGSGYGPGLGGNAGGGFYHVGGVYRASDAMEQGDVSANAFDDFFEYALAQPVTIHKNESAMVPILQQDLPAEHVTLWSDKGNTPLRAVWLDNTSKLTLDAGSFSIFENGEFAGEGLLDPVHPGEKRLLSYAVDQAVRVRRSGYNDTRTLRHIAVHDGMMVETTSEVTENTYTITNAADETRAVVIEHTRRPNSQLDSDTKPDETTATAYRFRVAVEPHQSADLHVAERAKLSESIGIGSQFNNGDFLVTVSRYSPALEEKLRPAIDAETALTDFNRKLDENDQQQKTLAGDEARDRDNITALKGNDAARRFVDELNQAEDQLQAARKNQADLEQQRDEAQAQLDAIIARLSFDTDLDVVTSTTR